MIWKMIVRLFFTAIILISPQLFAEVENSDESANRNQTTPLIIPDSKSSTIPIDFVESKENEFTEEIFDERQEEVNMLREADRLSAHRFRCEMYWGLNKFISDNKKFSLLQESQKKEWREKTSSLLDQTTFLHEASSQCYKDQLLYSHSGLAFWGLSHQFDIPIDSNEHVLLWIDFFTTRGRRFFSRWLERSSKYIPVLQPILAQYNLPSDMVYLAMIESGFSPQAYSWAHAAGVWQFIAPTGKRYGLNIDFWIDERRDYVRSTHAAAKYLSTLYNMFKDWKLAWAAYNCGEGKIKRAVEKFGTNNFWELIQESYLPKETKNYVPKLMAAAIIAKNPEHYGFATPLDTYELNEFDTITLEYATDIALIAKATETDEAAIKELNPSLLTFATPPIPNFSIKIPAGKKEIFERNFATIPKSKHIVFKQHRMRRGETLGHLARQYKTTVNGLMQANRISNPKRVRDGTILIIPVRGIEVVSENKNSNGVAIEEILPHSEEKETLKTTWISHRVQANETVWSIAQKYSVNMNDLLDWNNLSPQSLLSVGDNLKINSAKPKSFETSKRKTHTIYVVRNGDNLWGIAKKFGVSLHDIVSLNNLSQNRTLKIKQKLRIPLNE